MSFGAKLKKKTFDSWSFLDFCTLDPYNASRLMERRPTHTLVLPGEAYGFYDCVHTLTWNSPPDLTYPLSL